MTTTELKTFLQQSYSIAGRNHLLSCLFAKTFPEFTGARILSRDTDNVHLAQQMGTIALADGRNLGIFDVQVADNVQIARNRKGLRDIAAKYIDQYVINGALVFFHNPRQREYRLTFIASYSKFDLDTLDYVRHETAPRRYSFLLSPAESNTTASRRLMLLIEKKGNVTLEDLTDAFSVEKLNREFFKQFKEVYFTQAWHYLAEHYRPLFLENLPIPDQKEEKERQEKPIRDFAKKMLGRIVFLHFLQKKGWLGCPVDSLKWADGDKQFMQTLFQQFPDKPHFYSRCLTELFFNTLNNSNRPDFTFQVNGIQPCRVPYLNGGLFDKETGTSQQPEPTNLDLPASYFQQLLAFFDQYNFTIDENSPEDNEVGIDPEMLGHIFENLLEENREKGAFYTPKEIVHYMCQESLIQYLRSHLPECKVDGSPCAIAIEAFIRTGDLGNRSVKANYVVQNAKRIEDLLDRVKICDPAIGSGAFPMGLLQEIFKAKVTLDLTLDRGQAKKHIIQNSIHGVDLDRGAVDIARLRFWLSLVVDEDEPQPLPNLDYKIMQGNSLLERFEGVELLFEPKQFEVKIIKQVDLFGNIIDPQISIAEYLQTKQAMEEFDLTELEETYFATNDPVEKNRIRGKIDKFERDFIGQQLRQQLKDKQDLIKNKEKAAITQRDLKVITQLKAELTALQASAQRLNAITAGTKPYFLWHLYFMDIFAQGGFDIVIGNPPYIQLQRMGKDADELAQAGYESYVRTGDIYGLFYEQGVKLLKKGGVLTYITSNKWMKAGYGQSLRQYFINRCNPIKLIDFGGYQVFENATVDTNILIVRNEPYAQKTYTCVLTNGLNSLRNMSDFFQQNAVMTSFGQPEVGWVILSSAEARIKAKIEEAGKPLKEWDVNIYRGILTGFNEAFIIDGKTKDELITKCPKAAEIIRPLLRGQDIKRFKAISNEKWLINSHNGVRSLGIPPVNIHEYNSIYEHLEKYKNELSKRLDKGDHWSNLRNCAYIQEFEKSKIVWQELSRSGNAFCFIEGPMYLNNTCFMLTGLSTQELKYLTAILNHKVSLFYLEQVYNKLDNTGWRWFKVAVEKIPVPSPTSQIMTSISCLVDTIQEKYLRGIKCPNEEQELDEIIYKIFNLNDIESALLKTRIDAYFN